MPTRRILPRPLHADRSTWLYQGDALALLPHFPAARFDMVLADPPYCSGGRTRGDRVLRPSAKYLTDAPAHVLEFDGDARDGRSWRYWCHLWLSAAYAAAKPGAYAVSFIDWRQLPLLTDAFQSAGWILRGIAAWDKTAAARAAHTGYVRQQAEFLVWGTRGPCYHADGRGPFPGVYRHRVDHREKLHITGKPLALMRELVTWCPPGGLILDPFAGSATTLLAARLEGRRAVGIESNAAIARLAADRLRPPASADTATNGEPDRQPQETAP